MRYQVGGSLHASDPTYVMRQSDEHLYQALRQGDFCYVLNSRQMGKSSLLQRTSDRLQQAGYLCVYLDITQLGSENLTPLQWYYGIMTILYHGLSLDGRFSLKHWRSHHAELSPVQQLHQFVEDALQEVPIAQPIVVLIDEIDSLLSLPFSVSDFFAWIRHCYHQRSQNPQFQRLSFALFGVATPSDLIADKRRTPFNIGTAIELFGFQPDEVAPLIEGLSGIVSQPEVVLREVLRWTNGQPFLTQKLCQMVSQAGFEAPTQKLILPPGGEGLWVDHLVRSRVIQNWESQDAPEHLKTIRDRLLFNENRAGRLLGIYQQVLQSQSPAASPEPPSPPVAADDSPEQAELLLSGLVEKHNGILRVKNAIYQEVFNHAWIIKQLDRMRPHAQALNAWVESGFQDESRLLRGQTLQASLDWAQGKSLSDVQYQFLSASQDLERRIVQQQLESQRLQEVEARLELERNSSRRQRQLLTGMGMALGAAIFASALAIAAYQRSAVSEVQAIASASQGNFASNQRLDALLQAIRARRKFQSLLLFDNRLRTDLDRQTYRTLEQAVQGADETNRLIGHRGGILAVAHSPDGKWIGTGATDRTVRIWKPDGTIVHTFQTEIAVHGVAFSPDSQKIAAAGLDGIVRIWSIDGTLLQQFRAHDAPVWNVTFSPDGQFLVSSGGDRLAKIWRLDGTLVRRLAGHNAAVWQVAFHPSGQELVSSSVDGTLRFWTLTGDLIRTVSVSEAAVWSVSYSPNGRLIASGSADGLIRLWNSEGQRLNTLEGHTAEVLQIKFSDDGKMLASVSSDRTVKLWRADGSLLRTFRGHRSVIRSVSISPDNQTIASAAEDGQVKLWQQTPFSISITGLKDLVWQVVYAPASPGRTPLIATVAGAEVQLWHENGTLQKSTRLEGSRLVSGDFVRDQSILAVGSADNNLYLIPTSSKHLMSQTPIRLKGHNAMVLGVRYHPSGQFIFSAADDNTLRLWKRQPDGSFQLHQTIESHSGRAWDLALSPDGKWIASASIDGKVKLWTWASGDRLMPEPQVILKGHQSAVWGVDFSPDGQRLVSAGRDGQLILWDRQGRSLWKVEAGNLGLSRVSFSPDGQKIAVGGQDNTVQIWSVDGKLLRTLRGHDSSVRSVDFSPDGKTLVSGGEDQTAVLWKVEELLDLNLMKYGCSWIRGYLTTNVELNESDRRLCHEFF